MGGPGNEVGLGVDSRRVNILLIISSALLFISRSRMKVFGLVSSKDA